MTDEKLVIVYIEAADSEIPKIASEFKSKFDDLKNYRFVVTNVKLHTISARELKFLLTPKCDPCPPVGGEDAICRRCKEMYGETQ